MSYWNPDNKHYLYFHVTRDYQTPTNNYYLMVDTVKKEVFKVYEIPLKKFERRARLELIKLKWSTFITGQLWNIKNDQSDFMKRVRKDHGRDGTRVKYTTQGQWLKALKMVIEYDTLPIYAKMILQVNNKIKK